MASLPKIVKINKQFKKIIIKDLQYDSSYAELANKLARTVLSTNCIDKDIGTVREFLNVRSASAPA